MFMTWSLEDYFGKMSSIYNTIAKRNAMNDLMLATKVPSSIPDIDVPFVRIQQVSDV